MDILRRACGAKIRVKVIECEKEKITGEDFRCYWPSTFPVDDDCVRRAFYLEEKTPNSITLFSRTEVYSSSEIGTNMDEVLLNIKGKLNLACTCVDM